MYPLVFVIPTELDAGPEANLPLVLKYAAVPETYDGLESQVKFLEFPLTSNQEVPDPE